jgi:hypothetical protein
MDRMAESPRWKVIRVLNAVIWLTFVPLTFAELQTQAWQEEY